MPAASVWHPITSLLPPIHKESRFSVKAAGAKKDSKKKTDPTRDVAQEELSKPGLFAGLIGQRLVEAGYLTRAQVDDALAAQYETGLLFGEVCLLKGWITVKQLEQCLPPVRSRLGHSLLVCGYITIEQLYMALLEQRKSGERFGEILVSRGWIDVAALQAIWKESD